MKTFLRGISVAGLAFFPVVAFAQVNGPFQGGTSQSFLNNTGLGSVAGLFQSVLDWAVPTLIACAVVYFLYGVLMYVVTADDEEKKEKAKTTILYGIVGIFVMVSVYGLVTLVKRTFNLQEQPITIPQLPR